MARTRNGTSRRERFLRELSGVEDGLYRTAVRLVGDPVRAEDLLQETVLKAYRFFDSYRPGTNFRAWMHRVLYTMFVNTMRDREPRASPLESVSEPEVVRHELVDELDRPTHRARESAILQAVDDQVKQAVDELPPDLRTVFMLSTIEGLKYREIADVMGIPLGTVMSRLFRSRRMLQDRLSDYARESGFLIDGSAAEKAGE